VRFAKTSAGTRNGAVLGGVGLNAIIVSIQHGDTGGQEPERVGADSRSGLGRSIITMVQPAESLMGKDLTRRYGTNPAVRCPLLKSEMHGSEGPGKFQPVFRIPIENEIPGSGPKGKRLPNLLDDPTA
jgi:hypothetical protein